MDPYLSNIRFISHQHPNLVGGIPTPLNNIKVNWDYDIPNIWKNNIYVPNHQPGLYCGLQGIIPKKKLGSSTYFWLPTKAPNLIWTVLIRIPPTLRSLESIF